MAYFFAQQNPYGQLAYGAPPMPNAFGHRKQPAIAVPHAGGLIGPNSILGTPPGGRPGAPIPGLLHSFPGTQQPIMQPIIRAPARKVNTTSVYKPRITPPMDSKEVISKLEELTPNLNNADKFLQTSKSVSDLMSRGLTKATAEQFYNTLKKLSENIGKEGFNAVAVWRIFESASLKKFVFDNAVVEDIVTWKTEANKHVGPSMTAPKKRDSDVVNANGAKRARVEPKNVTFADLCDSNDILQEEVTTLRKQLSQQKQLIDFLYEQLKIDQPEFDHDLTEAAVDAADTAAAAATTSDGEAAADAAVTTEESNATMNEAETETTAEQDVTTPSDV